jgi:hypothetical protein
MALDCAVSCAAVLLSGEVPKFFDNVLSKRAGEAVTLKGHWWDARREVALEGVKEKSFKVRRTLAASRGQRKGKQLL